MSNFHGTKIDIWARFGLVGPSWYVTLTLQSLYFSKAYSICSRFELLTDVSRDLSQAEYKIIVFKAEQIHEMTIIFTQETCLP